MPPLLPYPPIARHTLIGDRRTAALVAADGTIDWWCAPRYDGPPLFGALLDVARGGSWRMGPAAPSFGAQRYLADTAVSPTSWSGPDGDLELLDLMPWPRDTRARATTGRLAILRRLRCTRGEITCAFELEPRHAFDGRFEISRDGEHLRFSAGALRLTVWTSHPVEVTDGRAHAWLRLGAGDEFYAVLEYGAARQPWSSREMRRTIEETVAYWRDWLGQLTYTGPRRDQICRSALTVHLLSYAPTGSMVAAPTTSLPERIGGDRNYDYRFAWVRDASLSLAVMALLGHTGAARRYMDWLSALESATDAPLQVVYRVNGETDLAQIERHDLAGYRESRPLRFGNHAAGQLQLDSLGYLADCALIYLEQGGAWREPYWQMIRRAAESTAAHWRLPDSGVWELPHPQHYVSSKVMSWVTLERAIRIAERIGQHDATTGWREMMDQIRVEVMERGWSARLGAFRQRYEAESLDASALLIPIMGFLPADHPRVASTVRAIEQHLTLNGFVHRFLARETPGHGDLPLGEFEGAFLPCTFWLATTYAMSGRTEKAERLLHTAEQIAGSPGLLAEEVDARNLSFLGNTPLLFAQVEYVRTILALAKHQRDA